MKFPVVLALLGCALAAGPGLASPPLEEIAEKLKSLPPHPRLLLPASGEEALKKRVQGNSALTAVHHAILAECESMLSLPPMERVQTGRWILPVSRECLRRVFYLAYAYRMTGEEKFLKRAEKEMLAAAAFSDWQPSHFLDTAEMTLALAIGYDWLYDRLPETSRKTIREAILTKGIGPSYNDRYNHWLRGSNNWNQVCNTGMAYGALAVAEDEPKLAAKTIHRSIESIPIPMGVYAPDGAYPEGYGYWGYGTTFNVLLLGALETALGTDFGLAALPGFMKTGAFPQNMTGPIGLVHNWSDCDEKAVLRPAVFWFADRLKEPSLLWTQRPFLTDEQTGNVKERLLPALIIWAGETDFDAIRPPSETLWVGQGSSAVGLMRTSWTDPNAIFVGFKAGSPSVNHAHMDVGSFVLDALGERWAMDFVRDSYSKLERKGMLRWQPSNQDSQRWQIFRNINQTHNTLTIDNQLQRADGHAKIDSWCDAPGNLSVISDLSQLYEGQAASVKRGIAIRDDKYVVVRDEVKAPDHPITLRWTLLTRANVTIMGPDTVKLSQNGKTLYLRFHTNAKITVKTWPTDPPQTWDTPNPGTYLVGFEVVISANTEQAFDSCFTTDPELKPPFASLADWAVNP